MQPVGVVNQVPQLVAALAEVNGACIGPAPDELTRECADMAREVLSRGVAGGDARRRAVRDLLRSGGFKPAGRNKPAQEYLLRTALRDSLLPTISNAVDVVNSISLSSGLPVSLVSLDRIGTQIVLRHGREGERFVFNQAGQELILPGLIVLCQDTPQGTIPVGSPVKDSMQAKVDASDHRLLACIYGSEAAVPGAELEDWAGQLAVGMQRWCDAQSSSTMIVPYADP